VVSALLVKFARSRRPERLWICGFHWCRCTSTGALILFCSQHGPKLRAAENAKSWFLHFLRRIEQTHGVNDFLRMLGFSFLLFIIKSIRHDIRSVGRVQHRIDSFIGVRCLSLDYHDGPSDSAPHVPMYHYATLRWASITSHHWVSALTPFEAASTSSSLVARSRNSKAHKNQPPRNLRDQQNYIVSHMRKQYLIDQQPFQRARSFVDSISKLEYLDNFPNASPLPAFTIRRNTIKSPINNEATNRKTLNQTKTQFHSSTKTINQTSRHESAILLTTASSPWLSHS